MSSESESRQTADVQGTVRVFEPFVDFGCNEDRSLGRRKLRPLNMTGGVDVGRCVAFPAAITDHETKPVLRSSSDPVSFM
jgi:hypothetical protein